MKMSRDKPLSFLRKAAVTAVVAAAIVGTTTVPASADGNIVYQTRCGVQYTGFHDGSLTSFVGSTRRAATGCGGSIGVALYSLGGLSGGGPAYSTGLYVSKNAGGQYSPYSGRHYYSGSSYFTS